MGILRRISAARARRLRKHIQANRCAVKPGITHRGIISRYTWGHSTVFIGRCWKCGHTTLV